MGAAKPVSDANFEADVLKSTGPVLVDFWAEWCGPCKAIAPFLEQLATDMDGKITVAKVDVDSNQAVARKYNITSIPTLMIFQNGEVKAMQRGALPKSALYSWVENALKA
jgi:thioredoxin 1